MSDTRSTVQYLYGLQYRGIKFGLRNIRKLLEYLGHPERSFASIHVAGTNGKGSTSAFLAAINTAAGWKTGLYTSPHLVRFTERIRCNGVELDELRLIEYVRGMRPTIERLGATFFEATTAVAFRAFADDGVDIGIIETGLGGRLDATNVARPLAGVITTIGLDHTELLGPTITHVAKEKGGIIKRNTPLVLGNIRRDAALVLREIARKRNARIFVAARTAAFAPRGTRGTVSFRTGLLRGTSVRPGLFGEFQAQNAALAAATMTVLDRIGVLRTSPEDLVRGLTDVVSLTGMRGRMEIVERPEGPYLLDVGHNPDGVGVFVNAVRRARIHPAVILFAAMADKDSTGMLKHLATLGVPIVMTRPGIPRAMSPDELTSRGNNLGLVCVTSDDVPTGMAMARAMAGRGLVVIMGSHYLVGEAIPLFVDR